MRKRWEKYSLKIIADYLPSIYFQFLISQGFAVRCRKTCQPRNIQVSGAKFARLTLFHLIDIISSSIVLETMEKQCERRGNEMFEKLQLDRFFPKKNFLESRRLTMRITLKMTMRMTTKMLTMTRVTRKMMVLRMTKQEEKILEQVQHLCRRLKCWQPERVRPRRLHRLAWHRHQVKLVDKFQQRTNRSVEYICQKS